MLMRARAELLRDAFGQRGVQIGDDDRRAFLGTFPRQCLCQSPAPRPLQRRFCRPDGLFLQDGCEYAALPARTIWSYQPTCKKPSFSRVYLKKSLRLHHSVFSVISALENLNLAPLNLRSSSLNGRKIRSCCRLFLFQIPLRSCFAFILQAALCFVKAQSAVFP